MKKQQKPVPQPKGIVVKTRIRVGAAKKGA
jgi:hypothetical protein